LGDQSCQRLTALYAVNILYMLPSSFLSFPLSLSLTRMPPPPFRSYASFNSPGSNLSALSGPYDDNDLEYFNSAPNNTKSRGYNYNMDESEHYNPLDFSTGTEPFPLLDETFGNPDDFLGRAAPPQANPRLQITEPQYPDAQSQYQNQLYTTHRATPEHSPSPASSAGSIEQQNYTGSASANPAHQPSPMMGNILPPAGFTEGLANLNFGAQVHGGAQSPPEGSAALTFQQQVSRVPTPITVPLNDESGSQHPSASASSPGTPGSMTAQRPVIITESLTSLSSPPIPSSSSDTPSNAYLHPQSQQGGSGDAPNIMLIPSSPGEQHSQATTTQSQQSPPSVDAPAQQQPQRPPGLQDFLSGGVSSSLAGPSAPPTWALGHRPRSQSHSDIARFGQQNQLAMGGMGYGSHLNASIYGNVGAGAGVVNNNLLGASAANTRLGQGSWQDPNLYSGYAFTAAQSQQQQQQVNRTVNPNEAFGGQQAPADTSAFDGLLAMPPSPEHGSTSLPLNAHPSQSGLQSYNSAPLLNITQAPVSSSMAATQSSPGSQQHSPAPSHSSVSTAGPSYFQLQQHQSLAPPQWHPGGSGVGAMLRRYKTTGSTPGHRRGALSEDIPSTTWERRNAVSANEFLRNITAPDGSLAPPSTSSTSSTSPSPPPMLGGGADSLGLGLGGGHYGSSASSAYGIDEEYGSLNGGTGPTRGRRRGSSAASERSPYHRHLSISPSPSRSPHFAQPNDLYNPSGSIANAPDILPATSVERQHVTTPATELASQSRRKNKAPFTCPVEGCGSTFTRQFNLKGHLRSHREERPYVCKWPKCNKGFARQHDCKRHEALHLNIRPFTCEGCGKTFARMDALNRHHKSEGGVECRHTSTTDLDGSGAGGGVANGGSSGEDVYGGGYSNGGGSWSNSAYVA
jgi:hypothetical protein